MPYKCRACDYYWPWEAGKPHVCPECKETTPWVSCETQELPRGRQATPDGWQCPRCKLKTPEVYLYYRKVCRGCFDELKELELQLKKSRIYKKDPPKPRVSFRSPRTEDWWCPDCGTKTQIPKEFEKCPICARTHVVCRACDQIKPKFRGKLCQDCYEKAHPPQPKLEKDPEPIPEILNDILAKATGKSIERIQKDTDRNYFMSTQEALEYGIIDKILEPRSKLTDKGKSK